MHAAYDLDRGRGTSRVMLGLGGASSARQPAVAPADVATPLLSAPLPAPLCAPDDVSLLTASGSGDRADDAVPPGARVDELHIGRGVGGPG